MDITQMRKVNEMARVLRQHGFAQDAQVAAAQNENLFFYTNDRYYPQEREASLKQETALPEQHSGEEVSLSVLSDTFGKLEQIEQNINERISTMENDFAMVIGKVNELIGVMKALEEKQEQVEQTMQRHAQQQTVQTTVQQPVQASVMQAAPQASQQAAAPQARSSARTGDFKPGDVDLNNFFYCGKK